MLAATVAIVTARPAIVVAAEALRLLRPLRRNDLIAEDDLSRQVIVPALAAVVAVAAVHQTIIHARDRVVPVSVAVIVVVAIMVATIPEPVPVEATAKTRT